LTDWSLAKCIGKTDLFFNDRLTQQASDICATCPIKSDCLKWALEYREAWGVWGGLSYNELRIVAASLGYEPPNRKAPEHGTESGHAWHRRRKLKDPNHVICQPCLDAYNAVAKVRMAKYRKQVRGEH